MQEPGSGDSTDEAEHLRPGQPVCRPPFNVLDEGAGEALSIEPEVGDKWQQSDNTSPP